MELAKRKFPEVPTGVDVTRQTLMSFLQIKSSMGLLEKIQQVKHQICQSRIETAHVCLEATAGADNPYSLLQWFRSGRTIIKSGAVAYVTWSNPVEVVPRVSLNCMK
jgi:hypothetical protein